MKTEINIQVS